MNETKGEKLKSKKEKVGTDGLSKKERRAQKVAEKKVEDSTAEIKPAEIKSAHVFNQKVVKDEVIVSKKERSAVKVNQKLQPAPVAVAAAAAEQCDKKKVLETSEVKADNAEGKSKAQLRAERRDLQEKQRLAKLAKETKPEVKKEVTTVIKVAAVVAPNVKLTRNLLIRKPNQVQLFNHLYFKPLPQNQTCIVKDVHPTFIRLGAQYSAKTILGSNARCLALLSAVKDLIRDFITPPKQELCRSLETYLQKSVDHLHKCRPFAVSMTNALRHFKVHLTQVKTEISDTEKVNELLEIVDSYIKDEIQTAGQAISMKVSEKICNGDVILTYGCSSLIKKILVDAKLKGKSFKVIIVDGRPLLEGREMLRKLANEGIDCKYVLINAASFIMRHASKVLLGAHALLANGYVMARTGTAQVALVAQIYSKPVLVCCETYKFCERVQTDSVVYNEMGDSTQLLNIDTLEEPSPLHNFKNCSSLTALNLMYDVTPPDLVTAVVTELAFLPCTSVPVILRIKPTE